MHILQQVGQTGYRPVEQAQVQQEGYDILHPKSVPVSQVTAEADHQDSAQGRDKLHRRMEDRTDLQRLQHRVDMFEILLIHLFRFIFFPPEGLDLMNAGKVVLQFAVQFTHLFLGDPEIRANLLGKDNTGNENQRNRRTRNQGQLCVNGQQYNQHAEECDQVGNRLGDHMGIQQFKVPGIIHHPAHQITGLFVMEISQVHPFQLVIRPGTQIPHQVPGRLMGQVIAQETEQDPQQV